MLLTICILLIMGAAFTGVYFLRNKDIELEKVKLNKLEQDNILLEKLVLTLPESERVDFVAKHMKKLFSDKAFYDHIEKILPLLEDISEDEFILEYARTGINPVQDK